MIVGFVLINIAPQHETEVYHKLSKISEIIELHPLFGEYDLIAKIQAKNHEELGSLVVNKIRSIQGVLNTKTMTGINF